MCRLARAVIARNIKCETVLFDAELIQQITEQGGGPRVLSGIISRHNKGSYFVQKEIYT